jgi:hypothetical protein
LRFDLGLRFAQLQGWAGMKFLAPFPSMSRITAAAGEIWHDRKFLPGLDHSGGTPAQHHLYIASEFDIAGGFRGGLRAPSPSDAGVGATFRRSTGEIQKYVRSSQPGRIHSPARAGCLGMQHALGVIDVGPPGAGNAVKLL